MKNRMFAWWMVVLLAGSGLVPGWAQTASPETAPPAAAPAETPPPGPAASLAPAATDGVLRVTIDVEDALVSQILNAFSKQTGRSIVIGPDITGRTTARMNNVPWDEALTAVLKPFNYGYYEQGSATVVYGTDPIQTRVFTIHHLDASDVEETIRSLLSPRGKLSKVTTRGQSWGNAAPVSGSSSVAGGDTMGRRKREQEAVEITRTKQFVVTDEKQALERIAAFLAEIDQPPQQVLIEARFLEVNPRMLRDIGLQFGSEGGFFTGDDAYAFGVETKGRDVAPGNFNAASLPSLASVAPFNAGMNLVFQKLTDVQYTILMHLMEEEAGANVLSAPRILTLNNHEASIIVGTKYPIINSDASDSGGGATITTSLRGYEDIGIQLNVLPQICAENLINMIVRPSVRELIGQKSGKTQSDDVIALTEYPVISTRETETQVLLRHGQTIVIGGLLKDRESKHELKVPFLGDIPLIGWFFRRETINTEKIDLLIFLTASIVPAEGSPLVQTNIATLAAAPAAAEESSPAKIVEEKKTAKALADQQAETAAQAKAEAVARKQEEERQALEAAAKQAADDAEKKAAELKVREEAVARQEAKLEAERQALAEKQAAEEARAKALAEKQALAERKAAEEERANALADKEAAQKAREAELAKQRAAEQKAKEDAIAKKQAEQKAREEAALAAEKKAAAEKQAARKAAEKQALAEKQAAEAAKAKALAEKEAAQKARADTIAKQRAAEQQAREEALAKKQAAREAAEKQALAEKQAEEEARRLAAAEKQAAAEARAAERARKEAVAQEERARVAAQKAAEQLARQEKAQAAAVVQESTP